MQTLMQELKKLEQGGTKIIFQNSKMFFEETKILPDFYYEDLEVISYLLNKKITNAKNSITEIEKERLSFCYKQVERKIPLILYLMESFGFLIDIKKLEELNKILDLKIEETCKNVWQEAGEEFNINSPKQVNEILFGKLGIKGGKKTAGGEFSTNASVLEDLAFEGVKIAELLIEARHYYKLKNTYTIPLLEKARNSVDFRIRSTFSSTQTLTGRLTSKNPNLQNLPIKTEIGTQIRKCFIAQNGWTIVSFDYSQIELRILAHIANIENLKQAFIKEQDIHLITASKIFNVDVAEVTNQMRSNAKAINFGIIYGLSAFSLAKSLKISNSQANNYIEEYFKQYSGIKEYMQLATENAKKDGFVRTILNKKCFLEGIDSSNFQVRNHALRAAINAGIQGSAADLIKKAMVDIYENNIINENCKLILQIHDELVFEIKNEELTEKTKIIKQYMENAIKLSVPIIVNTEIM